MVSVEEYITKAFIEIMKYEPMIKQKAVVYIYPDDYKEITEKYPLLKDAFDWRVTDLVDRGECILSWEGFDPLEFKL
ncbi:MAG: hypothetical protein IKN54_04355 [Lachnospiraceae bacterium]|nr:hypothetical protein [Lachnospiraceae bacterium]